MNKYIRRLEFMRIQMKLQKVRISLIALIVTIMGSMYFLAYILAGKESSVVLLYKITKREKLQVYGTAKEETIKFINYGNVGLFFKLIGVVGIVLLIISIIATKKRMTRIIKKYYYEWVVGNFARECFEEYKMDKNRKVDLSEINFDFQKYNERKTVFCGKTKDYIFEQVDFLDEHQACIGRAIKVKKLNVEDKSTKLRMLINNDNIKNKIVADDSLIDTGVDIVNGCTLYVENQEEYDYVMNTDLVNNIIDVMVKYAGLSIYINGDEIYAFYASNKIAFIPDLSIRFTIKEDGQRIKTDVYLIKDVACIINS